MIKEITFPYDLKGRKAICFVQMIQDLFKNEIFFEKHTRRVNAKSLLGILSLGILKGEEIKIYVAKEEDYVILEEVIYFIDKN